MVTSFRTALRKDGPSVGDVHVSNAGAGAKKPKKAKPFGAVISQDTKLPVTSADLAAQMEDGQAQQFGKDMVRALKPIDDNCSHSPFPYDPNALANIRPDQTPRFFGALTDPQNLEDKTVPLASLTAMQNRVDHNKVAAMRGNDAGKPPVVVRMNGRNYIADGHHRASAAYLNGKTSIPVKFKDLTPESNALKRADWSVPVTISKTDADQCLVFGWASVVEKDGRPVIDHQGDMIDVADLEQSVYKYVLNSREAGEMHDRTTGVGKLVESIVMTAEKQVAMGLPANSTPIGWWVGYKLQPDVFAKVKSGEYSMFSIGGGGIRVPTKG